MNGNASGLFSNHDQFPNDMAAARLSMLVGQEERINDLVANAVALLDSKGVEEWSKRTHSGTLIPAAQALLERAPVFIFAGDVGTGKTELAEVIGQAIAKHASQTVTLYPLSLTTRGRGSVGEMTTLLTSAFDMIRKDFATVRSASGKAASMGILFIDEADALAQSRELSDMHHEDRAGVNALLRGIDGLRADNLPILTILCTNRLASIDPAVRRRAASIQIFDRPNDEQRKTLLTSLLTGTSITSEQIDSIVLKTGILTDRQYGYTYSDLRTRFVPEVTIAAYRQDIAINNELLVEVLERTPATRPFEVSQNER